MTNFILLETGDALLQETGDNLLLDVIPPKEATSLSVDLNNGTIIRAKLIPTYTGNTPVFYMTADGTNFELITESVLHTFANTGDDLRWKVEGLGTTITNIKIEISRS